MLGEEAYQALRKEKGLEKDGLLLPDKIAETYYHLADQHRSAGRMKLILEPIMMILGGTRQEI